MFETVMLLALLVLAAVDAVLLPVVGIIAWRQYLCKTARQRREMICLALSGRDEVKWDEERMMPERRGSAWMNVPASRVDCGWYSGLRLAKAHIPVDDKFYARSGWRRANNN